MHDFGAESGFEKSTCDPVILRTVAWAARNRRKKRLPGFLGRSRYPPPGCFRFLKFPQARAVWKLRGLDPNSFLRRLAGLFVFPSPWIGVVDAPLAYLNRISGDASASTCGVLPPPRTVHRQVQYDGHHKSGHGREAWAVGWFMWVWVKNQPPGEPAGFCPCLHLPGQAILGTYF